MGNGDKGSSEGFLGGDVVAAATPAVIRRLLGNRLDLTSQLRQLRAGQSAKVARAPPLRKPDFSLARPAPLVSPSHSSLRFSTSSLTCLLLSLPRRLLRHRRRLRPPPPPPVGPLVPPTRLQSLVPEPHP